jgi:hypothetical protein
MRHRRLFALFIAAGCAPASPQGPTPAVEIPPASEAVGAPRPGDVLRPSEPVPCPLKSPEIDRESRLGGKAPEPERGNLMNPYFGGGFGFFPVRGPAPPPRRGQGPGPLELRVSAARTERGRADPLDLTVGFANLSGSPVVAIRPLDGSLEAWRYPRYDLYARDLSTGIVYRFAFVGGRCGNVNPVMPKDYVVVAPSEVRSDVVNGWASYLKGATLPRRGRYAVWVVYAFCGFETQGVPLGASETRDDPALGIFASNAVELVVR